MSELSSAKILLLKDNEPEMESENSHTEEKLEVALDAFSRLSIKNKHPLSDFIEFYPITKGLHIDVITLVPEIYSDFMKTKMPVICHGLYFEINRIDELSVEKPYCSSCMEKISYLLPETDKITASYFDMYAHADYFMNIVTMEMEYYGKKHNKNNAITTYFCNFCREFLFKTINHPNQMNSLMKNEYMILFFNENANKFNAQQQTRFVDKFTALEAQVRVHEKDVGRVKYLENFTNTTFDF